MIVRELEKQERKYALDIIWSVFCMDVAAHRSPRLHRHPHQGRSPQSAGVTELLCALPIPIKNMCIHGFADV